MSRRPHRPTTESDSESTAPILGEVLIARAPGRFGHLTVTDAGGLRGLFCGADCHGTAWLEPAVTVAGEYYRPGPIPEADYLLAWLLAASPDPAGHVLMAGLGSGVGPIALAWAYPELRITVAEIDPAIIALAREHFPLLRAYERSGRLTIIARDILDVVWAPGAAQWSLACLDAYQEQERFYCPGPLLQGLHGRADAVWLNILEVVDLRATCAYGEALLSAGWEPSCVLPIPEPGGGPHFGNVLLGTQRPATAALMNFTPFAGLEHPRADAAHRILARFAAALRPWAAVIEGEDHSA